MKVSIDYKGFEIVKNDYNYENLCYLNYAYYDLSDSECAARHGMSVDDCKEQIDELINEN